MHDKERLMCAFFKTHGKRVRQMAAPDKAIRPHPTPPPPPSLTHLAATWPRPAPPPSLSSAPTPDLIPSPPQHLLPPPTLSIAALTLSLEPSPWSPLSTPWRRQAAGRATVAARGRGDIGWPWAGVAHSSTPSSSPPTPDPTAGRVP
jgi:hypothetical protein